MSAETAAPIATYFRVHDGVRLRFADTRTDHESTVLLLAPWPETLWAFRRIWSPIAAVARVVALDLPGFGHSDGRPELIAPDACGNSWPVSSTHGVSAPRMSSARTSARLRHCSWLPATRSASPA